MKSKFAQGVFAGRNAIKEFLNPSNHPPVPLVELPPHLNPFLDRGVRIFAKLMFLVPLLNIKSLQVMSMLLEAQHSGGLEGVHTLVENTSGNTGFSLAVLARIFGAKHVVAIVPYDIAPGKREMLRLMGIDVRSSKGPPHEPGGIELARLMGQQEGFLNLGQYENEANPKAFEQWIAPQIWNQTEGNLSVFCAGLGTTGTVVGMSRYLRSVKSTVKIVGVNLLPGSAVPGCRTEEKLEEISFDWRSHLDCRVEVGTKESYWQSLKLCQAGLLGGPSSGFALAGLLKFFEETPSLESLQDEGGQIIAVFVCPDTPFPYLDKYSTILDPSDF